MGAPRGSLRNRDVTVAADSECPARSAKKSASTDSWSGSILKMSAHTSRTHSSIGVWAATTSPEPPMSRGVVGSGRVLRSTLPLGSIGSSSTHCR